MNTKTFRIDGTRFDLSWHNPLNVTIIVGRQATCFGRIDAEGKLDLSSTHLKPSVAYALAAKFDAVR
jgi:hypothetical protein